MKMPLLFAAVSMSAGALSFAYAADSVDPVTLFQQVPPPPQSISSAKVTIQGGELKAPAYDVIFKKIQEQESTITNDDYQKADAQQQANQFGLDIDVQRMESDPAYKEQMEKKFSSMSPAEAMAMSSKMAQAQRDTVQQGGERSLNRAKAINMLVEVKNSGVEEQIIAIFETALKDSDAQHAAVDKQTADAIERCPVLYSPTGGMENGPYEYIAPTCYNPLLDNAVKRHRDVENRALTKEAAAFKKAQGLASAQINKMKPLLAAARRDGELNDTANLTREIIGYTFRLTYYARAVTLAAGFWGSPSMAADIDTYGSRDTTGIKIDNQLEHINTKFFIKNANGPIDWPPRDTYGREKTTCSGTICQNSR